MASPDSDSKIGGKFRKRPFRRAPATPYDRPQTATRKANPYPKLNRTATSNSNGWLSKIVNPASRILAWGASRIFSSPAHIRLDAPPPQPQDENLLISHKTQEAVYDMHKSSDAATEQGGNLFENASNSFKADGKQQETLSGKDGFFDVEQLLKQKTFTRAESDQLTDFIRSRTVEPSTSQPTVVYEKKQEAIFTEQIKDSKLTIVEPGILQQSSSCGRKGKKVVSEQKGKNYLDLHNHIEGAVHLNIPEEEAASPAELAKAYMDSRSSKMSPSTLSGRKQIFQEDATLPTVPYANKPSTALLTSNSPFRFSDSLEQSENAYITPRSHGRSALYKMSRSPYFKTHAGYSIRGGRPLKSSIAGPSTSSPLGPLKVLKRGSSVLDSDFASSSSHRRTRQRSNLSSPSKRNSFLGNPLRTLPEPDYDFHCHSAQLPLQSNELKYGGNQSNTNLFLVPYQSTEMARKIFEVLDKIVPSPREKVSEKKVSGSLDVGSNSPLPSLRSSISAKQERIKKTDPSQTAEMIMAEESAELNASTNLSNVQGLSATGKDKVFKKSLPSSSESIPTNKKRVHFMLPSETASNSHPSATPIIPPKKELAAFTSKFDSEGSSTTTAISGSGESATPIKASPEDSDKSSISQKAGNIYTSFVKPTSPGLSTSTSPGLLTSGGSNGPKQSNGSITNEPETETVALEGKSLKPLPFTLNSLITPGTSNSFSNTSLPIFSSTGVISNTSPTSSLAPNAVSLSSPLSSSSTFTNLGNGIFGFSAATESGSSSSSLPLSTSLPHSSALQIELNASSSLGSENSPSIGNDQMIVQYGMATPKQAAAPLVPRFGQSVQSTPSVDFAAPAAPSGLPVFELGSHHTSTVPHNTSPFQGGGSQEFPSGGSFNLGSAAGGDNSSRRIIRVKRDKHRRK